MLGSNRRAAAAAAARPRGPSARTSRRPLAPVLGAILSLPLVLASGGCYAPQLTSLRSGLDSLRVVVDTLTVRDSLTYQVLADTRRELVEQRDILLSTRATAGTTTQQMFEQMEKLNTRLDEVLSRFHQVSSRMSAPPPAGPGAADPNQLYDQSTQDLTQGRYTLALQGFRDFVQRFGSSELADNAQYGVGECFFAQSRFDSAAAEYAVVEARWPSGDKVPASLWKTALCQDRLGKGDASKKTLQDLVKRYPQSGEAQLARERLGPTRRR